MSSPAKIIMEQRLETINELGIQVGNVVKLRNGVIGKISRIDLSYRTEYPITVKDIGSYTIEGKLSIYDDEECPTDIVDWNYRETVKYIFNNTACYSKEHSPGIVSYYYKDILNGTPSSKFIKHYKDKDCLPTEDTDNNNTTGFIKHDKGKPLVSLVEPDFILGVAEVMTQGAKEYGRDNWKECEEPHRYLDALLRHTLSYWKGDKIDDKSGKSHLFHIAFNAMALHYLDTKLKD